MIPSSSRPSVVRSLSRGLRGLRREGRWGSTLFMLCLVMTMLQGLVAGVIALQGVNQLLLSKSGIHVEVTRGAADRDVQELYGALKELPYVEQVEYIPREKALERERIRNPELVNSLQQFAVSNPFPDAFSVVLYSLDSYDELLQFLGQEEWNKAIDPAFLGAVASQQEEVRTYLTVSGSLASLGYLFLGLGILALCLIVLDIAYQRAHERRDELLLERVLGASAGQVLIPFAAEIGALLLLSLLAGAGITAALLYAVPLLLPEIGYGTMFEELRATVVPMLMVLFPLIVLGQALMLPLLGFVSGLLGARDKFMFRPS